MPINANDPGGSFSVGSGGGIDTSPFPTPPSVTPSDSPFIVIQKYRAAMAQFVGNFNLEITKYVDDFARIARPSHYRDDVFASPNGDELDLYESIIENAKGLLDQSDPIIDRLPA